MTIGRPALPILGILLAISGLVLGAFTFISVSRIDSQVADYFDQNSWYKYNGSNFNTDPIFTHLPISELTIEFELGLGDSVYFSFTCQTYINPEPTWWSRIYVFFRVDGINRLDPDTYPSAVVGVYQETIGSNFMIHLQDVCDDLSAGIHNVTVVIYGEKTGNYIWKSSLFVQKVST